MSDGLGGELPIPADSQLKRDMPLVPADSIAGRALVVSNGVGNWFPLRVQAPAEIVHSAMNSQPPA